MTKKAEEIKNRLSNIGEAIGNIALEYITELEKENAELELKIKKLTQHLDFQPMTALFEQVEEEVKLETENKKAKEIIKELLGCLYSVEYDHVSDLEEAEQFLNSEVAK